VIGVTNGLTLIRYHFLAEFLEQHRFTVKSSAKLIARRQQANTDFGVVVLQNVRDLVRQERIAKTHQRVARKFLGILHSITKRWYNLSHEQAFQPLIQRGILHCLQDRFVAFMPGFGDQCRVGCIEDSHFAKEKDLNVGSSDNIGVLREHKRCGFRLQRPQSVRLGHDQK
jgi:hypothetical protein